MYGIDILPARSYDLNMQDLLADLNESQRCAVTHGDGPLLIVAGAGTGKTTVLTRRYVHLLHSEGLKNDRLLALTFTEKAAGEMEDRVLRLLPNGAYDFWISTFHSFCQRILERYAFEIGLPNRFRLLNETDAWLLLKRRIAELPLEHYRPLGNPAKFLAAVLKHFSRAKDEGVTPERYHEFVESAVLRNDVDPSVQGGAGFLTHDTMRLKELAACYTAYHRILRDEDALDFGELILETLRLLRTSPRAFHELRAQFSHVLVDEFQDTNWAQYELIKLLTGEKRNITVVGDDDQAIYKFRGASLANILQFRDDYPEARIISLTENYRSCQEILDLAHTFIQKNDPNRLEGRLADVGLSKRLTSRVSPPATDEKHRKDRPAIQCHWFSTVEEEADGVAMKIREYKEADPTSAWNDFAVLARSNDGCEPFIQSLERQGIPYHVIAMRGLYAKPVIVDLTAVFTLCENFHESTAAWRVMNAPCYAFSAGEMAGFLQYAARRKGGSLWEAVSHARELPDLHDEGVRRAENFIAHVQRLTEAARRERPLKMLQLALEQTGYLSTIMKLPEREKLDALNYVNAFAQRIKRYEHATLAPTLRGFLEELRLEIESGEQGQLPQDADSGPDGVNVMTIHAAKGLEFSHVFVVSLVDQRFPTRMRGEAIPLPDGLVNERLPEGDTHLEEERRLFYVAMTRAKFHLTFTGAESYGGSRKKKPSAFLEEAGVLVPNTQEPTAPGRPYEGGDESRLYEREAFKLKRRFSFTQLAAFRTCPLQYKFAHVYRIPILGSYQKSYGQSMHLALHDILLLHLERGKAQQISLFEPQRATSEARKVNEFRVPLEEALDLFESRWIDEWYTTRLLHDQYREEGKRAIRRMHAAWSASPPDVAFLEQSFDWRVGEHSLKGSIDRIDSLSDGSYAIFDYKTAEPKTADELAPGDKEQLRIYQCAMEERGLPITRLAYLYLKDGSHAEVPLVQGEDRVNFRATLLARMNEIVSSQFDATPSSFVCKHCDFKSICEFRKS